MLFFSRFVHLFVRFAQISLFVFYISAAIRFLFSANSANALDAGNKSCYTITISLSLPCIVTDHQYQLAG